MRLLVLTSTYPRWAGDPEPGFVHELARRLTDSFEVSVLCPSAPGAARREVLDGVQVHRYRYAPRRLETLVNDGGITTNLRRSRWRWLLVPGFLLAQLWGTWWLVRRFKPDVIHCHWLIPQGLVITTLQIGLGLLGRKAPPFVVTSHGADLFALRAPMFMAMKRLVLRHAAAVTVVSQGMIEEIAKLGYPRKQVQVQPMGVDLQHRFTSGPAEQRDPNQLLFVGRLVEKKGLRYLIDALPLIAEQHPDVHLRIAGFGPEEAALRRQVETLDLTERVEFLGAVPQDRLPDLYRKAALFVAPFIQAESGDQEGLGLVTVEAIGCGCSVVVSDLPAVRDVVVNPNRRALPANSSDLADKIARILTCSPKERECTDRELRQRAVELFDWLRVADEYGKMLRKISG